MHLGPAIGDNIPDFRTRRPDNLGRMRGVDYMAPLRLKSRLGHFLPPGSDGPEGVLIGLSTPLMYKIVRIIPPGAS